MERNNCKRKTMKILYLTSRLPFPPIGGDKLRAYNFIKHIKKQHHLTLISFIEHDKELDCVADYRSCYDKLLTIKLPKSESYRNCLKGIASPKPLQVHYYYSEAMQSLVQAELRNGYDTVVCHLIRMAQYLPTGNGVHKVLDLTDAISLNYLRSRKFRRGFFSLVNLIESKRVRDYERTAIHRANSSIFISNVDARFLSNHQNESKIHVVPNGVDLQKFQYHTGAYDLDMISFVGNMRTFPNSDAVTYFANEILPLLKQRRPDLKFYVVGNEPTREILKLHDGRHIFVTGYVDSVIPYLQKSAVMVAPMRAGAGIQNKILEAMAVGVPVVTTSVGAEGLEPAELTIADAPGELSQEILHLIEDKQHRKNQSASGRKYVEENYSWDENLRKLDKCLVNGHGAQLTKEQATDSH